MPTFDPNPWNTPISIAQNNCYNYALDRRDDVPRNPGQLRGMVLQPHEFSVGYRIAFGAIMDGLEPVADPFPVGHYGANVWPVALVTAPPGAVSWHGDYHWLRRDDSGCWSHKTGFGSQATNVDDSGAVIIDPRRCNLGPYLCFVGFFAVDPTKLGA